MASVLQMSMQLRMLFVGCVYQDRLQMECTIEQVKLAASVWFSEDERDAGFCFTYQPGLVSS